MSPLRKLSPLSQRVVGIIIIVLALMTVGSTAYYSHEQREITRCQAQYNDRFAQQIEERNRIAESDRKNLTELVKAVVNSKSREESHKALEKYLEIMEKNDEDRQDHPLPGLPEKSAHC